MTSNEQRKEALKAYKEREEVGGLYRIVHRAGGWESPLCATPNLQGQENKLRFTKKTDTCTDSMLKEPWSRLSHDGFAFVVVEKLVKKPEMTPAEFREELADLLKLWVAEGE